MTADNPQTATVSAFFVSEARFPHRSGFRRVSWGTIANNYLEIRCSEFDIQNDWNNELCLDAITF